MTAPAFRTTRRVEFADTDMAGIVHFANFFRWMEAAEVEFLRSLGLSVAMTADGLKLGLPRVSASCDFLKPARFEDVLEVSVILEKVGRKSLTYLFDFHKQGEHIARGRISAVCCRVEENRKLEAIEIPAAIREVLQKASNHGSRD
jgi:YbgC/YbaW family acyl-CoA thioester hydrolase